MLIPLLGSGSHQVYPFFHADLFLGIKTPFRLPLTASDKELHLTFTDSLQIALSGQDFCVVAWGGLKKCGNNIIIAVLVLCETRVFKAEDVVPADPAHRARSRRKQKAREDLPSCFVSEVLLEARISTGSLQSDEETSLLSHLNCQT